MGDMRVMFFMWDNSPQDALLSAAGDPGWGFYLSFMMGFSAWGFPRRSCPLLSRDTQTGPGPYTASLTMCHYFS